LIFWGVFVVVWFFLGGVFCAMGHKQYMGYCQTLIGMYGTKQYDGHKKAVGLNYNYCFGCVHHLYEFSVTIR
jgi:hypothetical protein